ncbi:hypothetical protein EVAR_61819_1 [Eumeta japonica]|uniref:Uncharacterized protein n=1 Tax=Eumeta variegata TaxID=151549 RepID=A0A4C1YX39_EUMVA|nr:hypothetical protein EVAR_61819_1 [Eumeta japonica]
MQLILRYSRAQTHGTTYDRAIINISKKITGHWGQRNVTLTRVTMSAVKKKAYRFVESYFCLSVRGLAKLYFYKLQFDIVIEVKLNSSQAKNVQ